MKHTGLVVHIGDVVGLLSDYAGLQALAVAPCRDHASASPLGDETCSAAAPGLPSLQGVRSRAAWLSSLVVEELAVPPGLPHGSPAGGSAAWPVSPARSATSPGLPNGSPARAPAAWLDSSSCAPATSRSIFSAGPVVLAADTPGPAAWPRLPESFFAPRDYPISSVALPPMSASGIPVDFGGLGSSPVSPALSASSVDSVDMVGSSPRSRRRRRRARSPRGNDVHPASSSSSSCASQGGGSKNDPLTGSGDEVATAQVADESTGSTVTTGQPPRLRGRSTSGSTARAAIDVAGYFPGLP